MNCDKSAGNLAMVILLLARVVIIMLKRGFVLAGQAYRVGNVFIGGWSFGGGYICQ